MKALTIIAFSEIQSLFREKIIYSIASVFIFMAILSSYITWATYSTVGTVYSSSIAFMHQHGIIEIPTNPFHQIPTLATFDNLIVYITLIGTLLAIVVGHRSMMRERISGILQLVFSRPILKRDVLLGKVLGLAIVLLSVVILTAFVSIVSLWFLPLQLLTTTDVAHLLFFFSLSFLYMFFFALIGLLLSIATKSESLALFIPILIWVGITFVLPELSTGQSPTALLNPVTLLQVPPAEGLFQQIQFVVTPMSLGWHYTTISGEVLGSSLTADHSLKQILADHWVHIITFISGIVFTVLFSSKYLEAFNPQGDVVKE